MSEQQNKQESQPYQLAEKDKEFLQKVVNVFQESELNGFDYVHLLSLAVNVELQIALQAQLKEMNASEQQVEVLKKRQEGLYQNILAYAKGTGMDRFSMHLLFSAMLVAFTEEGRLAVMEAGKDEVQKETTDNATE